MKGPDSTEPAQLQHLYFAYSVLFIIDQSSHHAALYSWVLWHLKSSWSFCILHFRSILVGNCMQAFQSNYSQ